MNLSNQQPGQIATARSARVAASRKLLRRAARRSEGAFLADGPQAVREALRFHGSDADDVRVEVHEVYVDAALIERHRELLELAEARGLRVVPCDAKAIGSLSDAVTPQGILARCSTLDVPLSALVHPTFVDDRRSRAETSQAESVRNHGARLLAVPVDVRDPGNLGTIIRCADASGAGGVAILGDSVDPYNPKAVRSTAGSLFHVPITIDPDPFAAITAMKGSGLQIIATEGEASTDLDDVIDTGGLAAPTAWLFGNEAHGLPDEIAELADIRLRIPIRGYAESLNLSTAAAICLFASARAQR